MTDDEAIERLRRALDAMEGAAAENIERSRELQRRVRKVRRRLDAGRPVTPLLEDEPRPGIAELLSANLSTLESAGSELRAALAMALRTEGLTLEAIAELFGVTRQRISALLRQKADPPRA